ncbi:MAG: hypothetical protein V4577_04470 [Bacteroidota bacterium]
MDAARVATLVHKTPTPVRQRIHRLKEDGYIKIFAAILDREKIGRPVLVVTHVRFEKQTTPLLSEFEQWAVAMEESPVLPPRLRRMELYPPNHRCHPTGLFSVPDGKGQQPAQRRPYRQLLRDEGVQKLRAGQQVAKTR